MTSSRALLGLALCGACVGQPDAPADGSAPPVADGAIAADGAPAADAAGPGALLGSFQLTYYWITTEEEFADEPDDTDIYDPECVVLATVPAGFADSLRIEGTGRLEDGVVLNYDGACPCALSPCYHPVDAEHPWGSGSGNRALAPFRSVAVDRDVVAIGTALYLVELDGVTMPGDPPWGGFVHDGCVSADDTGGSIDGQHVDFFAAFRVHYRTLDDELGIDSVTVHEGGPRCR